MNTANLHKVRAILAANPNFPESSRDEILASLQNSDVGVFLFSGKLGCGLFHSTSSVAKVIDENWRNSDELRGAITSEGEFFHNLEIRLTNPMRRRF